MHRRPRARGEPERGRKDPAHERGLEREEHTYIYIYIYIEREREISCYTVLYNIVLHLVCVSRNGSEKLPALQ